MEEYTLKPKQMEKYGIINIPFELYTYSTHIAALYDVFIPTEITMRQDIEVYQIIGWSPQFAEVDLDTPLPHYNPFIEEDGSVTFNNM